jgi:hypothetical protein
MTQFPGQECSLIVPSFSLAAAMQRHRHNGIQSEVTRSQSLPPLCHQMPQERSQTPQVLVLELVNSLAQRSAVKSIGPEPVELEWRNLAASAKIRAPVVQGTGQRQATVLANRGLNRLDGIQAVCT